MNIKITAWGYQILRIVQLYLSGVKMQSPKKDCVIFSVQIGPMVRGSLYWYNLK